MCSHAHLYPILGSSRLVQLREVPYWPRGHTDPATWCQLPPPSWLWGQLGGQATGHEGGGVLSPAARAPTRGTRLRFRG